MSDEIPVLGCTCDKCTEARLNLELHSQRHEFHLLDSFTAYCICGWTDTRYSTTEPPNLITPLLARAYREHLD